MINFDGVAAQFPRQVIPRPIGGGRIGVRNHGSGWLCRDQDPPCGLWHLIEDCVMPVGVSGGSSKEVANK